MVVASCPILTNHPMLTPAQTMATKPIPSMISNQSERQRRRRPWPARRRDPDPARPEWRVRSGDYRRLYRIEDAVLTVIIVDAGHRREIYR